jgi:hypothetical protein
MTLTKATYSLINGPVGNVKDFGAKGDGVTNDTAALQAAITSICNAEGILLFPPGVYKISAPLTFPNKSFVIRGSGPTATNISEIAGSGLIKLFDLTGTNGPSVVIENMGFFGPTTAPPSYGGDGCYFANSNGVSLINCWFAGLTNGINKQNTSSFVRVLDCTFEFCVTGISFNDGVQCIVNNTTFYRNTTDYNLTGSCSLGLFTNSTHGETITNCFFLNGVTDAIIENVTCRQDFTSYTPVIMELANSCKRNIIRNIRTYNFGTKLIKLNSGASNNNNLFDGLYSTIQPVVPPSLPLPAGTGGSGIEIGASNQNNTFSNFNFIGLTTAIVEAGGANIFNDGIINTSITAGIRIQDADNCEFFGVTLVNNTVDWVTSGTVNSVWLANIKGTVTGLTPQRYGSRGAGPLGRLFYGTAAPSTLAYLQGDRVLNITPAVGTPKGWACTVAGTPGTWVSEGNL